MKAVLSRSPVDITRRFEMPFDRAAMRRGVWRGREVAIVVLPSRADLPERFFHI
jgi:hypothetical protein